MGACCGTKESTRKKSLQQQRTSRFLSFINHEESLLLSYDIIKKIGEGATGHVKSIVCKKTSLNRAAKSIIFNSLRSREKSKKEIEILKLLDYPTLLRSFESYTEHKHIHIISELYTGMSLYDVLHDSNGISEIQACKYLKHIASGVKYLHGLGIVHRDLKLENLIFESEKPDSLLKIIDFGSADFIKKEGFNGKCGTVLYMSPQVIDGKYTEKCDVWSTGIIFYVMIMGSHPFYSDSEQDMLDKIRHLPVQFKSDKWQNVSPDVIDLIKKMLSKTEAARPSITEVLTHACLSHQHLPSPLLQNPFFHYAIKNELHRSIINFCIIRVLDTSKFGEIFMSIDRDCDGLISQNDLNFIESNASELHKIFKYFGKGQITYTEFVISCYNWEDVLSQNTCANIFELLDKDLDGLISIWDFSIYSTNLAALEADFSEITKNESTVGMINFDQFLKIIK